MVWYWSHPAPPFPTQPPPPPPLVNTQPCHCIVSITRLSCFLLNLQQITTRRDNSPLLISQCSVTLQIKYCAPAINSFDFDFWTYFVFHSYKCMRELTDLYRWLQRVSIIATPLGKASPPSPFCVEATSYIPSLTHLELFNNNSTISWKIVINVEKL